MTFWNDAPLRASVTARLSFPHSCLVWQWTVNGITFFWMQFQTNSKSNHIHCWYSATFQVAGSNRPTISEGERIWCSSTASKFQPPDIPEHGAAWWPQCLCNMLDFETAIKLSVICFYKIPIGIKDEIKKVKMFDKELQYRVGFILSIRWTIIATYLMWWI